MQKLTENIYVETGNRGCNTSFVVTSEGIVMIDTPMIPAEAKKWRDEIARYGQVRYVINGEPHQDHVSGNCYFTGTGVAHEGVRQSILAMKDEDFKNSLKMMAPDSLPLDADFRYKAPEITFTDRLTLFLGSHTFQLMHLPGHTPFQVSTYVPEEKVVFTSDNVVVGMPFFHQALPYDWIESLKQLEQLDIAKIVTGHGPVSEKTYLAQMKATVQYWIDVTLKTISQGMTGEEAAEKADVREKYPETAKDERARGIKRMNIAHLYEVLKK
jgi:cyclase